VNKFFCPFCHNSEFSVKLKQYREQFCCQKTSTVKIGG
jgi:hypothetical protein